MIYKNSSIPNNFNKIAEFGDNYVIFVKESLLNSGTNYEAYIQFFQPSYAYFYVDNYRIKTGSSYNYEVNYENNGMYSYIDSVDSSYTLNTLSVDDDFISSEDSSRFDILNIFFGQILVCICILWVFKQLSRLVYKGGLS